MKKIIHLSDLHVGYPGLDARLRELVRNLIFLKEPASDYVVLITGDHVEDATEYDAYAAPRRALDGLREAGFTVLSCPGNHDLGTGTLGGKQFVPLFARAFLGGEAEFPKLDVVDGCAFVGLNSMAEELNWYDRLFAQGELGDAQLGRLDALLADPRVTAAEKRVVYLHHHPFDARPLHGLKDSAALGEIVRGRGNVDALLYGHNHVGLVANGKWGVPRCYDGGTATYKPGVPPRGVGHHRVIDLTGDPRLDYDGGFLPPALKNRPASTPVVEAVAEQVAAGGVTSAAAETVAAAGAAAR